MCGISVTLSLEPDKSADLKALKRMNALIRHRGPDDAGYLCVLPSNEVHSYADKDSIPEVKRRFPFLQPNLKARLGMGFRRLAIIDLSEAGHQPMSDPQLKLHIVFNGEIYNYPELREELKNLGYVFTSHSDTEVILKAYHAWGEDCLKRFNGIWAFAIWDENRQLLFCARDRFGVKPLYYCVEDNALFLGSELKQLLAVIRDQSLNQAMLWRSMKINGMQVYGDETYWNRINCLQPGHKLLAQNRRIRVEQYYRLDQNGWHQSQTSLEEATEIYRKHFLRAVNWQLRSDVEVGSCLSGGLDSSAIVCSAAGFTDKPLHTFSSWFGEDPSLDERRWIKEVVNNSNAVSHLVSPSAAEAFAWLEGATWFNDLPLGSGFAAQYAVMKMAQCQGIKVLLDGQGSDELTGGYRHAQYRYFADLIRSARFRSLASALGPYLKSGKPIEGAGKLAKTALSVLLPESKLYRMEFRLLRFEPFSAEFRAQIKNQAGNELLSKIEDLGSGRLDSFLFNMVYTTSLPTLLHWEDRMSMAASVESRVPFLDHELVELAFSLPSDYKIKPPQGKLIHRLAMKDIVPSAIYKRKDKAIFGSPFSRLWLRRELRAEVEAVFTSPSFRQRGIWDLPKIWSQWRRFLKGDGFQSEMIFNVLALEIWFRKCVDASVGATSAEL